MSLNNHFDILAPFYDKVIKPANITKIETLLNLPISGTLLDAGGGTGRVSTQFTGKASSIFVADLSLPMLRQTIQKSELSPACTHTEYLPFPRNYFERIIIVDAFHHVCDQAKTAEELWRVLAPGGRIVVEEPNFHLFGVKMVALAEKIFLMRSKFLPPEKIQFLFKFKYSNSFIDYDGYNSWIVIDKIKK
ncbi:MAG: class I SAM-dependent methyltransferase [Anaerolineales bacterium]